MRLLAAIVTASMLTSCQQDQRGFQFRGLTSAATLQQAQRLKTVKDCAPTVGLTYCSFADETVAGAYGINSKIGFDQGRFAELSVQFDPHDLRQVRENLVSAYGSPCAIEDGEFDTSAGPSRGNERDYWCFKEGRLVLELYAYGVSLDRSLLEFPALPRTTTSTAIPSTL